MISVALASTERSEATEAALASEATDATEAADAAAKMAASEATEATEATEASDSNWTESKLLDSSGVYKVLVIVMVLTIVVSDDATSSAKIVGMANKIDEQIKLVYFIS